MGTREQKMGGGGDTHQPSVPTHLPIVGISQRAAIDLIEDVTGQHHLIHLRLALREHLGDKDPAIYISGGAAEPQLSPRDPAQLPKLFHTISDIPLIQGGREKSPMDSRYQQG